MRSQVAFPMKVWWWIGQFRQGWWTMWQLLGFKMHSGHLWYYICVVLIRYMFDTIFIVK